MKLPSYAEYSIRPGDLFGILRGPAARRCVSYIRLGQYFRARGRGWLAKFFSNRLQSYGLYISPQAIISRYVKFPHPTSIVIGKGVIIEERVKIYQGVTLGGARIGDFERDNYPTIGAGAVIFSGAAIVGRVSVGKECIVGANSVVLSDMPDGAVCVGAPAKVVSSKHVETDR